MKNSEIVNILLVEPRPPAEHVFSRAKIPRLGSVLLGTILRDRGYTVRVIIEETSGTVAEEDLRWADMVGLSSITSTIPRAYALGDRARELGKKVVFGGPHVTFLPEEAMLHGDFVVRGEGEKTLPALLSAVNEGRSLEDIRGLSFREEGRCRHNLDQPLLHDLDTLPIPDFSLIRGWNPRQAVVPIATSRGCPFACKFCSVVTMFGRAYRFRSPDLIMEEIRRNASMANHLFFCDDNFAAHPARAKELLMRLKQEGFRTSWSTQVRAESAFDREFLELLRETHCWGVYIGFESADDRVLQAYHKKQNQKNMEKAIQAFHREGIRIHGMFMVGADEDTEETIQATVRFAVRNRIDSAQFMMLTPLPGTETFETLEREDRLLTRRWELYDGSHVVHRPLRMTEAELQQAAYRALDTFYSRRAILRRLMKLDLYYGYIRLYGRRLLKRARERMENHRRWLSEKFMEQVREQFAAVWHFRGTKRVALAAGNAGELYQTFLKQFLTRLGVEVLPSPDRIDRPSALTKKVHLVLVPFFLHLQEEKKRLASSWEEVYGGFKEKLPEGWITVRFPVDLKKESFYRACFRIGLFFSSNTEKIRRAYRRTCRRLSFPPGGEIEPAAGN